MDLILWPFSLTKINPERHQKYPEAIVAVTVARNLCLWVPIILGPVNQGTLFKVNGQHLKIFLEPNKESEDLDEIDFFCFPTNINFRP
jgi:hypothetical protein